MREEGAMLSKEIRKYRSGNVAHRIGASERGSSHSPGQVDIGMASAVVNRNSYSLLAYFT